MTNSACADTFRMRRTTFADLGTVLYHRLQMFRDMGYSDAERMKAVASISEQQFAATLTDGTYQGWFIENQAGEVIAGGGIILVTYPPSPRDPHHRRAWVVNIYTEQAYRRRGLARRLMQAMIDWCHEEGYDSVFLHASKEGRPLYESLGFVATNEMRLTFHSRGYSLAPAGTAK